MAEPTMRIPSEFVGPTTELAGLEESFFVALEDCLNRSSSVVDRAALAAAAAECSGLTIEMADGLMDVALSLRGAADQVGIEALDRFAVGISNSTDLDDELDRGRLADRIRRVIASESIELIAAARDLLGEHDHVLVGVRIVSDIRPLFSPDSTEEMRGAVVGHSLRLNLAGAEPRTIEISLDAADLIRFDHVIRRAQDKESRLGRLVQDAGLPLVNPFSVANLEVEDG